MTKYDTSVSSLTAPKEGENKDLLLTDEEILQSLKEANRNYKPSRDHYLVLNSDIELRAFLQAQLSKVRKAGYKSPEEVEAWQTDFTDKMATKYEKQVAEIEAGYVSKEECDALSYTKGVLDGRKGYVKLADDQNLTENPYKTCALDWGSGELGYKKAQQDMLKAGWRKVEVKDG